MPKVDELTISCFVHIDKRFSFRIYASFIFDFSPRNGIVCLLNLTHYELSDKALYEILQWKGYKVVTRTTPSLKLTNLLVYHETIKNYCIHTIDDVINS